jgi:hypothetical protein
LPITAADCSSDFCFHERPDAFLQEEGVTLGLRDQELLQWLEVGRAAEQGLEELFGALGRQGVDAKLAIVRLAAPAVLVIRAVSDEEQDAQSREAFDEAVEQCLGLRVDPVEILEEHK